ncbi:MAG: penicillin-binding transpeptidase domain-containing protein [Ilumatobacteraceae bacterium]
MNKQIRRLAVGLAACYVLLFVQLNVLQVGRQTALNGDFRNQRQTERDFNKPRGPIVSSDGVVLAETVPSAPGDKIKYQRTYPTGDLFSNVTGYYTFAYGSTQLERSKNDVLTGSTSEQQLRALPNLLGGGDNTGSVVLTMRDDVQQVAAKALGGHEGSVVVMDPHSGAVLAMVSNPRFDPNPIADHDTAKAGAFLDALNQYPGKPLLANAYQERYMPGSAFKVLTTSIAFEDGVTTMDRSFPVLTSWTPPQTTNPIGNYGGEACGGTMAVVFYRSCNIPFAQMAIELGPQRMVDGVKKWGVGEKLPFDLPGAVASKFGEVADFTNSLPLLGIGGFGQGEDQMVPLHMAMVASTVANGGQMMKPYAIKATLDHKGGVLDQTQPAVWKEPILASTAATLTTLMIGVVNQGTARQMQLANNIQAAAKTGTAQLNSKGQPEQSNAWIIGFAPADNPKYAIAVVLRGGPNDAISASTGGRLAGPIAKAVLDYMFANNTPTS